MRLLHALSLFLVLSALALPAHAQMPRRNPVLNNVAEDFITCAVFYKVTSACVAGSGSANKDLVQRADAAATSLMAAARRLYQKQGMIHDKQDVLTVQNLSAAREARLRKEAGAKCENLDNFMDRRGDLCRRIAGNPDAYLNDKLSQGK